MTDTTPPGNAAPLVPVHAEQLPIPKDLLSAAGRSPLPERRGRLLAERKAQGRAPATLDVTVFPESPAMNEQELQQEVDTWDLMSQAVRGGSYVDPIQEGIDIFPARLTRRVETYLGKSRVADERGVIGIGADLNREDIQQNMMDLFQIGPAEVGEYRAGKRTLTEAQADELLLETTREVNQRLTEAATDSGILVPERHRNAVSALHLVAPEKAAKVIEHYANAAPRAREVSPEGREVLPETRGEVTDVDIPTTVPPLELEELAIETILEGVEVRSPVAITMAQLAKEFGGLDLISGRMTPSGAKVGLEDFIVGTRDELGGKRKLPRGIRNNNPGNIEFRSSVKWQGQLGSDGRFIKFDSPEMGIRALARVLKNYKRIHGIATIRDAINRWAPPFENNTEAYVKSVAKATGLKADEAINLEDPVVLAKVIPSIVKHENGQQPYDDATIAEGIRRA